MGLRLTGITLFLPVPLVLWLLTAQPWGALTSLAFGVVLVLTHRLYARPFALVHAPRRCLWCGATRASVSLDLEEPFGPTRWAACSDVHADKARSFLGWAARHAVFLKVGILGSLALLAGLSLVAALAPTVGVAPADGPALFRLGVALTVLPLGWLGPRSTPAARRLPFPLHIQALIGTWAVSWLFRVVGLVWLVLSVRHILLRLT